jgi:hypothetical protein
MVSRTTRKSCHSDQYLACPELANPTVSPTVIAPSRSDASAVTRATRTLGLKLPAGPARAIRHADLAWLLSGQ